MPVETALGLMISFGSLIATIIFGILAVVNNNQKNNIKLVTVLNGAVRELLAQLLFSYPL
ncbi:putative holin-like toxin [Enterococcus lactis]